MSEKCWLIKNKWNHDQNTLMICLIWVYIGSRNFRLKTVAAKVLIIMPSKNTTSQQRRYNVAATSWRCSDVVATLCVCWVSRCGDRSYSLLFASKYVVADIFLICIRCTQSFHRVESFCTQLNMLLYDRNSRENCHFQAFHKGCQYNIFCRLIVIWLKYCWRWIRKIHSIIATDKRRYPHNILLISPQKTTQVDVLIGSAPARRF